MKKNKHTNKLKLSSTRLKYFMWRISKVSSKTSQSITKQLHFIHRIKLAFQNFPINNIHNTSNRHLWCTSYKFNNMVHLTNILKDQIKTMSCTRWLIDVFMLLRNQTPCGHISCCIINHYMYYIEWTHSFNHLIK